MSSAPSKEELAKQVPQLVGRRGPVRFALVGLGRAGHFHLQSMKQLGPSVAKLLYAIDSDQAKADEVAAEYGYGKDDDDKCQALTDVQPALDDPRVDAIIVASTTDTHFAYCKQALQAKKACFTEKPISHHPEEVAEVLELARGSGLPFIVGFQRRCDKNFRELKRVVESGEIGQPRVIRCTSRDNPIPPMAYLRTSGGIFHDMLSHDFDMIHYLTGEIPDAVYSIGHCYDEEIKQMGDADTVVVTMSFKSGLLATVDTSRVASYGYDQRVEVFGEHGMVNTFNEPETTVEVATKTGFKKPVSEWSFPQRYKHTYTIELAEYCAMLAHTPMMVEDEATLMRHAELEKVATCAEFSWKLGRKVFLTEVDVLREAERKGELKAQ
mmetsp:Transcript_9359/g.20460  ORF Transcript_9359/g.20460 Transcript_9359/m.20460 type:complete len:382 (+) Transcript_9359:65-1210(+)|eukprot:CAMPEP_0204269344 /NCGR_PEP_ID=MMETSP0468-20130131/15899_1 /ASSEMBLY_ACC=CAM_ASM_000383 /TAXON_ID=2969 /ORGANISM="Oxyrrhis marina" /LENGTH=381 /DNA_ID=CAMNT_0051244719 /DNA_START=53 /DNA_END=1198 /DNA_ORIENTATION=+